MQDEVVLQIGIEVEKFYIEEVSKKYVIDKKNIKFLVNIIFIICFRYISMLFNFC